MSFSETIFLFVVALIIFGPKKLPEIARQVGKALNEFKRASNEFKAQIEQEISHLEVENKQTILPPSQPPEGATSRSRYADAELHHVETPALTGAASEGASAPGESSSGEVASSQVVSGDAASEHASSNQAPSHEAPVAAEQNPSAASDPSEAVTASDPVGAAVAQESHSSESHFSEPHA
jgi:TatA/E family protein of Tat protein translocase